MPALLDIALALFVLTGAVLLATTAFALIKELAKPKKDEDKN